MKPVVEYLVTTRHAHIWCMVCNDETRLLTKKIPPSAAAGRHKVQIEDCCARCNGHYYHPYSPREWNQLLKGALVTRDRVYLRNVARAFCGWGPIEFSWAESSTSIIFKANLRMARDREISEEEKKTCLICFELKANYEESYLNLRRKSTGLL